MKNLKKEVIGSSLSLGLSLFFSATSVLAGDMGPVEPELWRGAYFGLHAGSGAGHVRQAFNDTSRISITSLLVEVSAGLINTINGSGTLHGDVTGSLANAFIGYNFHKPCSSYVLGAQLEGTLFSDIVLKGTGTKSVNQTIDSTSNGVIIAENTLNGQFDFQREDELRSTFNFIARAGYLPWENTLVYALGGVVEGHFVRPIGGRDSTYPDAVLAANFNNNIAFNDARGIWKTGGTVGAGIEYKFCEYLSFLAEYRYMAFNYTRHPTYSSDGTLTQPVAGVVTITDQSYNLDLSNRVNFNLGQIGIVYRV